MELSAILGAVFIAILVFLAYMGFSAYLEKRRKFEELKERLGEQSQYRNASYGSDEIGLGADEAMQSIGMEKAPAAYVAPMRALLRLFGTNIDAAIQAKQIDFLRAGFRSESAIITYLFFQRIMSIVFLVLAGLILLQVKDVSDDLLSLLVGLFVLVIGVFGPKLYVDNARAHRVKALNQSFPDMLDLILVCIESGLALDAALARVCQEMELAHPEMTEELNYMRLEFSMLDDRIRALSNFAHRTYLPCTRSLAAALTQAEKFGVSMGESLRVLAEDYRVLRLSTAEEKAGRLPALITLPMVVLLLPALFLIILGPSVIRVMENGGLFGG